MCNGLCVNVSTNLLSVFYTQFDFSYLPCRIVAPSFVVYQFWAAVDPLYHVVDFLSQPVSFDDQPCIFPASALCIIFPVPSFLRRCSIWFLPALVFSLVSGRFSLLCGLVIARFWCTPRPPRLGMQMACIFDRGQGCA